MTNIFGKSFTKDVLICNLIKWRTKFYSIVSIIFSKIQDSHTICCRSSWYILLSTRVFANWNARYYIKILLLQLSYHIQRITNDILNSKLHYQNRNVFSLLRLNIFLRINNWNCEVKLISHGEWNDIQNRNLRVGVFLFPKGVKMYSTFFAWGYSFSSEHLTFLSHFEIQIKYLKNINYVIIVRTICTYRFT